MIPALIKKCVDASESGADHVEVWGTGSASREYLYVDDAADAIVRASEIDTNAEPINLGADREVTIRETVETVARLVGFDGELRWDPSKPDGQPRRAVDGHACSRAARLVADDAVRARASRDHRLVPRQPGRRRTRPPLIPDASRRRQVSLKLIGRE